MNEEIQINVRKLRPFTRFIYTIGELPTSYLMSMTYEEQLVWFCNYLEKTVIPTIDNNGKAVEELQNLYLQLQEYVTNYFENLDVQEEIDNKLDEMAESGELATIIAQFLSFNITFTYDTVADLKSAENLVNNNYAKTLGYHAVNDGGASLYKVRSVRLSDVVDESFIIALQNDLVAELIPSNELDPKQLGAYGDGEHDDTEKIQLAFSSNYNIKFSKGTYIVSKNTDLEFTNHDEPCLAIINQNAKIINGNGATLKVYEHAQGILEIINSSNIIVDNLKLIGCEYQVALDGRTGRGEKGNNTEGYDTDGYWGYYKNNSYDTSESTTHGNNGNPWGKFHDGFIGNISHGILIRDGSNNIEIKNCDISHFNYRGIGLGFAGDNSESLNPSYNIKIHDNTVHNCYSTGIGGIHCNDIFIENNYIYDIGHEEALYTDEHVDPGYGIGFSSNIYNSANKVTISGNHTLNAKRKGIDLHGGYEMNIINNIIDNSFICGIFAHSTNDDPDAYIGKLNIISNQILNSVYGGGLLNPINVSAINDGSTSAKNDVIANICDNIIENCGCASAFIYSHSGNNMNIANNIITGFNSNCTTETFTGIAVGTTGQQASKNCQIINNIITTLCNRGASLINCEDGIIANNNLNATTGTVATSSSNIVSYGNINKVDSASSGSQQGFTVPYLYTSGNVATMKKSQLATYLGGLLLKDLDGYINQIPNIIDLTITANGTDEPTVVVNKGSDFINSVVDNTRGLEIQLKNVSRTPTIDYEWVSANSYYNGSNYVGYIYNRGISTTSIVLGLKTSASASGHIAISSCSSGSLNVKILL